MVVSLSRIQGSRAIENTDSDLRHTWVWIRGQPHNQSRAIYPPGPRFSHLSEGRDVRGAAWWVVTGLGNEQWAWLISGSRWTFTVLASQNLRC